MNSELQRVEIKQTRGPTVRFTGRQIAKSLHTTTAREPMRMTLRIWETEGGALVAVSASEPIDKPGFADVRAEVVEPSAFDTSLASGPDEQTMRFAVMDFFNWDNRARSMVRKQLGWSLVQEVA